MPAEVHIRYQVPYDWNSMLEFFKTRAIPGVEIVKNNTYKRSIEIDGQSGFIEVRHRAKRQGVHLSIYFPSLVATREIVNRVRRLFDLGADIETIQEHLSSDKDLRPWVIRNRGLRAPGAWDGFELAVRAVLGQQVSLQAARKLGGKLVTLHGQPVTGVIEYPSELTHTFPTAKCIAGLDSVRLGMPGSRIKTLQAIARESLEDSELFQTSGDLDSTLTRLIAIPGIGDWTAQYISLRAIHVADAFPSSDIGLLRGAEKVLGMRFTAKTLVQRAERWRPWRAYAAQHLWAADAGKRDDQILASTERTH